MINLKPKLEDRIASVKEHIVLLEQANKSTEKFEMLLRTLESKQVKWQGRQMGVKDVKQETIPDENECDYDFEIDLDPQMEVEIDDLDEIICLDFEPLQPKVNPWDDLMKRNGCEGDK